VVVVVQLVTTPLQAAQSRRYEAEADWAALQTTRDPEALKALFRRFTAKALADPDPPGWYHALFDDHPSGLERVEMAEAWSRR
jgi:STE24 endopeptidase